LRFGDLQWKPPQFGSSLEICLENIREIVHGVFTKKKKSIDNFPFGKQIQTKGHPQSDYRD